MKSEEKLQYYLNLPYPIEIVEDEDAIVASIPDLPGCNAFGQDVNDALRSLKETKELWLKGRIDSQQPIPGPSTAEEYSGKFVLRIPKTLHRTLDREAKKQGTSLNQYVLFLLSDRHNLASFQKFVDSATASRGDSRLKKLSSRDSASGLLQLDKRCHDADGEIRVKRSETLISSLRKTYGKNFASGYRGDIPLDTLLKREGAHSLSDYLKKTKP